MQPHEFANANREVEKILRECSVANSPTTLCVDEYIEPTLAWLTREDKGPLASKWEDFTKAFGFFRPREFTVLCGTTGTGKTAFLSNLSTQFMVQTIPHFVASVETGPLDYMARLISTLEGMDFNSGDQVDRETLSNVFKKWRPVFKNRNVFLSTYTNKINPRKLLCDLWYAHEHYGCKVAFIDNLNFLMPIVNSSDSVKAMDEVVHDFIIFCKNIDMHIVMVMHPKKKEDADGCVRVQNEYDIKGSSTVIQEAHNVLLLNKPTLSQQKEGFAASTHRELTLAKLRRRGQFIGKRIMFEQQSSRYIEKGFI